MKISFLQGEMSLTNSITQLEIYDIFIEDTMNIFKMKILQISKKR